MKKMNLQLRIFVSIVGVAILTFFVMILFVSLKTESITKSTALDYARSLSAYHASVIQSELQTATDAVRTLAISFQKFEQIRIEDRRKLVNSQLRATFEENKELLSIWTTWEPNALDGLDNQKQNKEFSNEKGRCVITWYRNKNEIKSGFSTEKDLLGDFYQIPKKTNQETVTDPYYYSYTSDKNDSVFEVSFAIPIRSNTGEFIGVVGVDVGIAHLQSVVEKIKVLNSGYGVLLANNGIRLYHPLKQNIGVLYGEDIPDQQKSILDSIKNGATFYCPRYELKLRTFSAFFSSSKNISCVCFYTKVKIE